MKEQPVCKVSFITITPEGMSDSIIDLFGNDVVVSYRDETHAKAIIPVALIDACISWVFGLGKRIRLAAPEEAVEGMKNLLQSPHSDEKTSLMRAPACLRETP